MRRQIGFEEFSDIEVPEIVFEVALKRSPILKDIDGLFRELKNAPQDKRIWRALEKKIQEFSGIKKVYIGVDKSFDNVFIIPRYKNNLPGIFDEVEINKNKINAEESAKYIDLVVIVYGEKMIDRCSPRECTAFLLHELGHVYQHTAQYSFKLKKILFTKSRDIFKHTGPLMGLASLWNPAYLPFLISSFLFSRTLTFFEHKNELNADEYAAKYGYAEEIASIFLKFHKKFDNSNKSWIDRVWAFIKNFLLPDTHPADKDRICNMINRMKDNYNKKYPRLKKKFNIIYADLKC